MKSTFKQKVSIFQYSKTELIENQLYPICVRTLVKYSSVQFSSSVFRLFTFMATSQIVTIC